MLVDHSRFLLQHGFARGADGVYVRDGVSVAPLETESLDGLLPRSNVIGAAALDTERAPAYQEPQPTPGSIGLRRRYSILRVPFHSDAVTSMTFTTQPTAEQFLLNSARHVTKVDLSWYTQVRLVGRLLIASTSPFGPRLRLRYSTTFQSAIGSYSGIGTTVAVNLRDLGVNASAWIDLERPARADVFLAISQLGGDGASSPVGGHLMAEFRKRVRE